MLVPTKSPTGRCPVPTPKSRDEGCHPISLTGCGRGTRTYGATTPATHPGRSSPAATSRPANGERREADVARGQRQVGEDEGEVVAVGLNRRLVKRDTHLADPADSLVLSSSRASFRAGDPDDAYHLVLWAADVPPSERHERTCEWEQRWPRWQRGAGTGQWRA